MTTPELKRRVNAFRKVHKLNKITYCELCRAAQERGYTVVEFHHLANDAAVEQLLSALQLGEYAAAAKGFTYADANQRLIFIHESLAAPEKILVIAHELGHIVCEHLQTAPIIGKDVKDEYAANEFAHYLLNPTPWRRFLAFCRRHWIFVTFAVLALLLGAAALGILVSGTVKDHIGQEFCVTEHGTKYHEKECVTVKQRSALRRITREELESGDYEPCEVCLP